MSILHGILDNKNKIFRTLSNRLKSLTVTTLNTTTLDATTLNATTLDATTLTTDGITYTDTYWDDLRFQAIGQNIDTASGRIDYNFSECGIGYQNNSRYPEEVLCIICQMTHKYKIGTSIYPHIHYAQAENKVPNWLLEYRLYDKGETIPGSWTKMTGSDVFTYTSGTIHQVHNFGEISMSSISNISSMIEFKIYRDTGNVSTEFAGADPYTGTVLLKEFDVHYEMDMPGSRQQYIK